MTLSLYDRVGVRLTPEGRRAYVNHYARLARRVGRPVEPPAPDPDGYSWFPLHQLLRVFGPVMDWGGPLPFDLTMKLADV